METDKAWLGSSEAFDPVAYINAPTWHASRMGMERIVELTAALGNPQERLRIVHVAGTNGKGSTCAFVASVLQEAGYMVGLFTSPYIVDFNERIRVNGCNISADDLLSATLAVREVAEAMEDHPTEFELMTAVALVHFERVGCDVVVLEVGLGGRLDSTNVVPAPLVCAIAPIALDHTALLGGTIAEIAGEKAGIIKPGAQVCVGVQPPEALEVIRRAFDRANAGAGPAAADPAVADVPASPAAALACYPDCSEGPSRPLPLARMRIVDEAALSGAPASFSYKGYANLHIGLLGSYQTQNAALAVEVVEALRDCGFAITDQAVVHGLANTRWPGRFERVAEHPTFIVDGGHNPQGAAALADSLALNFPGARPVFLVGILADKDFRDMLRVVVPLGSAFVCVTPPSPRALPAADLAQAIRGVASEAPGRGDGVEVVEARGFADGVARARCLAGKDGLVMAFGSLYSISSIMDAL